MRITSSPKVADQISARRRGSLTLERAAHRKLIRRTAKRPLLAPAEILGGRLFRRVRPTRVSGTKAHGAGPIGDLHRFCAQPPGSRPAAPLENGGGVGE